MREHSATSLPCHHCKRIFARVFPKADHLFTLVKPRAVVESEDVSGHLADLSQRTNCFLLQSKVFRPTISAGIEKTRELTRCRN